MLDFHVPTRLTQPIFAFARRLLGFDVRFFAKNATIVTISYGVTVLRGLITGYLVARIFPRELYGQYQFILTAVGTVGAISLPGIINALSRAVARGEKGVIIPVARIQFCIALVAAMILLGAIPFLPEERKMLWPLFVLAAVIFPVSQTASTLFTAVTVGNARFDVSLKANIAWSSVMAIATLGIIFLHPSAALLYTAATTLPALSYLWFSRPLVERTTPEPTVRHIIQYGIQLTLVSLPVSLSWYIDKLMISALFGLNQLAVFTVAILIPEQAKSLTKELFPISFSIQSKGEDTFHRRKRLIHAVFRATLLFSIGIVAYIIAAPWIYSLLFPNYPEAIFLSQLAAAMLIMQPTALTTQYLEAQAMLSALRKTQWISASVFAASLVILIPLWGLAGAILCRGILRLTYAACSIYFLMTTPPQKSI